MPSAGVTRASGSPSTTTWWASRARRRRWSSATLRAARARFASAPAVSCCRTTRRSWSPSSSARSRRFIQAASISAWVALPAPTSARCARCDAITGARSRFRRTSSSCKRCLRRARRSKSSRPCPARGSTCPFGSWARAFTARSLPRPSACRTRSRRTSRPTSSFAALATYRAAFRPSAQLAAPHAMVGANVVVGADRRGSSAALHVRATGRHELAARRARPASAADRRHRNVLDAIGKGAGVAHARLLVRRLAGHGPRPPR